MNPLFAYIATAGESRLVGRLYSNLRRGRVTSTFAYDGDYLASKEAYNLEPGLPLTVGAAQAVDGALPLSFQDAAPDRWGRNLIAKRIRSEWAAEGRVIGSVDERSYLLGVSDHTRQGALRFAEEEGGTFQHPSTEVPKLISLPELMQAADQVAREGPGIRDYLEIAETLPEHSSRTVADLQQLWRRIAFSIAIHNTDDHLRNHGFLRKGGGWVLAPAFDVNPNPQLGDGRITSVGGAGSAEEEVRALVNYADVFNMTEERARATLSEVAKVAAGWAAAARRNGIDEEQIAMFAPALNGCVAVVGSAGAD